jgi:hypothetical protein
MSLFKTLSTISGTFIIGVRGTPCGIPPGVFRPTEEILRIQVTREGVYYHIETLTTHLFLDTKMFLLVFLKSHICYVIQGSRVLWSHDETPAKKIQGAWRRHRLRTTRDRNDLVIRGLAEYFGHPRFQDFLIDDEEGAHLS